MCSAPGPPKLWYGPDEYPKYTCALLINSVTKKQLEDDAISSRFKIISYYLSLGTRKSLKMKPLMKESIEGVFVNPL